MFPECRLGAEGERRVGTCMPYTCTCRIATGEFVALVYVLVVRINIPSEGWQLGSLHSPILP